MKKLRQTLALALAVLLLVSVIPFSAVAETDYSAKFEVATLNGAVYNGSAPINGGDTLTVNVSANPGSGTLRGFMLGFAYDSDALIYEGTQFLASPKYEAATQMDGYIKIGAMIAASTVETTVATITFTVVDGFTGETNVLANQGTSNYLSIKYDGSTGVDSMPVVAQGCSITVLASVNKAALAATIADAEDLDEDDYTPNSWDAFTPVLNAAINVYNDAFATQDDVDEANQDLLDAIAALVETADKLALNRAIKAAKDELAKTSEYTAASLAALRAAVNTAEDVFDDENASQDEVDAQTKAVNDAIAALVSNDVAVTFLDAQGNVFEIVYVPYGGNVTLPATTPEKASDNEWNYTFKEWSGQLTNITAPVTITPLFNNTAREYTITFEDEDGSEIEKQTYTYNAVITPPADPTKADDDTYTYAFAAWSPALENVTGDSTYTATYTATYKEYDIVFISEGEEVASYKLHWGDEVTVPADPSKAQDDTYTYTFAGWGDVVNVAGNATYTASFTPVYREYTIVFQNYDGSEISSQTLHWGEQVQIPDDPTKEDDNTYTHAFIGWTPAVVETVAGDATYVAQFSDDYKNFEVKFFDEDGETQIGETQVLHYGDTVVVPDDPTKAEDDTFTYTFAGWTPEVDVVTGDISYTATYTATYKEYDIVFISEGEEVASYKLHWGDEVTAPADPTKEGTAQYSYNFTGWDPAVVAVAGDATYTAQFSETVKTYTVYFLNWDDSVFAQQQYEYGAVPTTPEGTPERPDDEEHFYTFTVWAPEFAAVTGDTNYKAQFESDYLGADYDAVDEAVALAANYDSNDYTEVSYARLMNALLAVVPDLKINEQTRVDGFATAINDAIAALVSTTAYDAEYAKCAAVNNNLGLYTAESYNAFEQAFAATGEKQDFNTEEATQAQVDAATKALEDAYALLQASTLLIDGAKKALDENDILTASNTTVLTTALTANDGGAGTAELKFYDAQGNEFTSTSLRIGTGFKVELVQFGDVKITKYVVVYGDINGDGIVNLLDIRLAKKMLNSTDGFTELQILAAKCGGADIDVDAVIGIAKAI